MLAAAAAMLATFPNLDLTWDDLDWLRGQTELPLLVKGVLRAEPTRRLAFEHGADGVSVSNHGGRQVDGAVATLDALVEVRAEIGPEAVVLMDGGIRRGADVLKALALGADAVLLGRPYAYGLAVGGQEGVEAVVTHLIADTDITLALVGAREHRRTGRRLGSRRRPDRARPRGGRADRARAARPRRGARPHRGERRVPHRPAHRSDRRLAATAAGTPRPRGRGGGRSSRRRRRARACRRPGDRRLALALRRCRWCDAGPRHLCRTPPGPGRANAPGRRPRRWSAPFRRGRSRRGSSCTAPRASRYARPCPPSRRA